VSDAASDDGIEDLPPATAPEGFSLSMQGSFGSEDRCRRLGDKIYAAIHVLSSYIDLSRLDGVTVADDYAGALRSLDRGFEASQPLVPSANGVAMAPAVKRDGIIKGHLVFATGIVLALEDGSDPEAARDALYTIAHESAHVADLRERDEAFPGVILQAVVSRYDQQVVGPAAAGLWEEYTACRQSAQFARERQVGDYATTFFEALDGARERSNAVIRAYRLHADTSRVVGEVMDHTIRPIRMYAYLLGTIDGLGAEIERVTPAVASAISGSPFADVLGRTKTALRQIWDRRGQWRDLHEFDALDQIVRDALEAAGIIFTLKPNDVVHVGLPFRPGTMPGDEDAPQ
jgi:hypothetical protein